MPSLFAIIVDHPSDPALADRLEFRRDDFIMPARREQGTRVEFVERRSASSWIADALDGLWAFRK